MMGHLAAAAMVVLLVVGAADASPSADEVLQRVLRINPDTPNLAAADVLFKLRVNKPVTDPPDCEFTAAMQFTGGRQSVQVGSRTGGLFCWAVNKYVLGRLFEASEPMESFVDRFDFHVLGEKLLGDTHYYLIEGKARAANNEPRAMMGWVDYDHGLVTDGRIEYGWGTIDAEQRYARVNGAWVLAYQLIRSSRFGATLEAYYSNYRFAPRSGSAVAPRDLIGGSRPIRPATPPRSPRASPGRRPRGTSA